MTWQPIKFVRPARIVTDRLMGADNCYKLASIGCGALCDPRVVGVIFRLIPLRLQSSNLYHMNE